MRAVNISGRVNAVGALRLVLLLQLVQVEIQLGQVVARRASRAVRDNLALISVLLLTHLAHLAYISGQLDRLQVEKLMVLFCLCMR